MSWKRHKNDGATSWTKTIGATHVIVANNEGSYAASSSPGRGYVFVWTSVCGNWPNDPFRALVHRSWSVKDAKAWAEKEYS